MTGAQRANFMLLAHKFDFSKYQTLSDIGGSGATFSSIVGKVHPKLKCTSYDLALLEPVAKEMIKAEGMEGKVQTGVLDFFKDDFPKSDIIVMGNILHDWD